MKQVRSSECGVRSLGGEAPAGGIYLSFLSSLPLWQCGFVRSQSPVVRRDLDNEVAAGATRKKFSVRILLGGFVHKFARGAGFVGVFARVIEFS